MSLTHYPDCHGLSFVDAASCPSCAQAFLPGQLQKVADAENRAFKRRGVILFFALLSISLIIVLIVVVQGYVSSMGVAHS